jgi:hypothetical protein
MAQNAERDGLGSSSPQIDRRLSSVCSCCDAETSLKFLFDSIEDSGVALEE